MSELDNAITRLQADVAKLTVANKAAVDRLNAIPGQIDAAVQQALANGATTAQLQSLSDLSDSIEADTAALTAAENPPADPAAA